MICVIFNPTARGDKAKTFRARLAQLQGVEFRPTTGPGTAPMLAAAAVEDGATTVVAAGGDGTVNEVLNGVASLPGGFARARLAVLPLGTVNVFAKELRIPTDFTQAWRVIQVGHERIIDLPHADPVTPGETGRRYFAQMAGAGIDSRALSLVNWELKKRAGALAYVWASMKALRGPRPQVTVDAAGQKVTGQLVLIGNGRFYGGRYPVFPAARLDDGRLDVTVFPRVNWFTITRVFLSLQGNRLARSPDAICFQSESLTLSARDGTPWHVEGDNAGPLPRRFSIRPRALRVVVPG
ncbi:MAG TPA: diacylglycerol kinase family protein [Candidatus Limnocylindria bacterium]|nr:diacylglycerol kinase family protein [Candidatus Limnocylindria bacterium]